MRPRLLHVVESFGGGVATFVQALLAHPRSYEFETFLVHGTRRSDLIDIVGLDVTTIAWPSAVREVEPVNDARALRELVRILREVRPAVVHAHSSKAGLLARVAALLVGRPRNVVYTPHAVAFLRTDVWPVTRAAYAFVEWLGGTLPARVVACSHSESAALKARGIRCETIVNGVTPSVSRWAAPRGHGPLQVVTVGRASPQKDPGFFAQVAATFAGRTDVRFTWIGDGELRAVLDEAGVHVTGWLDADAVRSRLVEADVYLSTSAWEGMPLSVLEAMAAGLPVVLRRCVGNVDLAQHGNGYLFSTVAEAVACLEEVARSSEMRERLGRASVAAVETHYLADRMAAEYYALYDGLMRRAAPQR